MLRSLLACSLLCATPLAAEKQDGYDMVQEFVAELKKVVPEGWKVTVNELHVDDWRFTYDRDEVNIEVWRIERAEFRAAAEVNPFDPVPANKEGDDGPLNPFAPVGADEDEEHGADDPLEAEPEPSGLDEALGGSGGSIPIKELMKGLSEAQRERFHDELKGRIHPYFNFHLVDYITPEEYARRVAHDAAVGKRLMEFAESLKDIDHHGKAMAFGNFSSSIFYPKTDEEKKRVKEMADYERANPRHGVGPNCYYKTLSFYLANHTSWRSPKSKDVRNECEAVLKKIEPLFHYYEAKWPEK